MKNLENKEIMAKNLRHFIDASGKDDKEIADAVGVAPATMSEWLNAKKYPRIDKIELLASYFHVKKSDLIEDKGGYEEADDNMRLEALHQNPRLGLLFDHQRKMRPEDVEFMIQMAERIIKESDKK